ncbi:MAG: NAD(+) synthase [Treponema sp.]|jgi:NAD+ synthase|nr:NAD(+) synthase [Treponema sp.]
MFAAEKVRDEIVRWIRGYFGDGGGNLSAVVGISGGKDSSVVAALCAQALGPERVYGVLMPRGEQWDLHFSQDLVRHLGIRHSVINIGKIMDSFGEAMSGGGMPLNRQAAVNTPARVRMSVLYAVSAIVGGRVANTCNLSEDWVGYATKFGDGAGDFSPLSHLTVTEVRAVGRALGLPSHIVEKVPEDGLTGLSDEDNLGFSYDVLDRYIREGICEDGATKEKIDRLYQANLHKLSLMPSFELAPSR